MFQTEQFKSPFLPLSQNQVVILTAMFQESMKCLRVPASFYTRNNVNQKKNYFQSDAKCGVKQDKSSDVFSLTLVYVVYGCKETHKTGIV